jgi:2-polyprenyl-3-methyl-5-hydroxy-6-metoxy-1,4-benzoquinol methylase
VSSQDYTWLRAYQEVGALWGLRPDWRLIEYLPMIPEGSVLDLGMGNGRNTLFLAKLGFEVDCVDVSKTYVKRCQARAEADQLTVNSYLMDIRAFKILKRRYALIIVSKVLQFFQKPEIENLAANIMKGLARRGLIYARVFSLEELSNVRDLGALEKLDEHTYYHPRYQVYQHFFTKDEVLTLFPKMKVLCCVEGVELNPSYKKPRYQWIIEYLGQRRR